jgi:minor extracellular serine protease Vpr
MRISFVAGVSLLITTLFGAPSHVILGQEPVELPTIDRNIGDRSSAWFVELASEPAADGTSVATLESEERRFHEAAQAASIEYIEQRHFRRLWNGLSVTTSRDGAARLALLPGVRALYPVLPVALAQDVPADRADLAAALAQTGADVAQNTLGLSGKGIRVAVMDSGIDYDHPDLGGCFGPGCRVEKGWDFVGDAYDSSQASPLRLPDPFPDDCFGHGTHVAGIIGANGRLRGVAPQVTFHAYRVFGCAGTTNADVMLEAMERVLADGADVLNMSIGASFQWPRYPTAQGADWLAKKGVVVVASIGNSGASGLYAGSAPGIGERVIGVASFDNTYRYFPAIAISPDGYLAGYVPANGAPAPPSAGSFPLSRTGTTTSPADACNGITAPAPGSLSGTVALIRRGTCSAYEKALNAQSAGAVGVVVYNNGPGRATLNLAGTPPVTIPVVLITAADGALADNRVAAGPVTVSWTHETVIEPHPTAGLISGFSSYGIAPDLSVKPDIGAPGGSVLSTLPLEQGGFGPSSGTSMASPHVAGAAALLLEARPDIGGRQIRDVLQNNGDPRPRGGSVSGLDNVHRQGAGMLNIIEAVQATAIVSPGKLALGEVESGPVTRRLTIRPLLSPFDGDAWTSSDTVTYQVGHEPALSTGPNTFLPEIVGSSGTVRFSRPSVTIGGDADKTSFDVTFTPPPNAAARLFGGYITLTPDNGDPVLRVPYAGYNGDYQVIPALVPTANNFPWLARRAGATTFVNQPDGAIFTLAADDVPYLLIHLDHQVERLFLEVFDVTNGESRGLALAEKFVPRSSGASTFFALPWDGTTAWGTRELPNGTYQIRVSVLKALGDRENPAHWQSWMSPSITLARAAPPTP